MNEDKQSLTSDDDNKLSSTHDELLARIDEQEFAYDNLGRALIAVVELHKVMDNLAGEFCKQCSVEEANIYCIYPCPTIQAIEKELE